MTSDFLLLLFRVKKPHLTWPVFNSKIEIVHRGEVGGFYECNYEIKVVGERRYLNCSGGRSDFVIRNCHALHGVIRHPKFQPKLSLIVSNPTIVGALESVSRRIHDQFGLREGQTVRIP